MCNHIKGNWFVSMYGLNQKTETTRRNANAQSYQR